jgi:hypothetical protein
VTIPAHVAGDMLIVGAYNNAAATIATTPAAGGTVPTWTTIDAPAGANLNSLKVVWAAAAGTTDTSGSWTNATHMVAIVLRGQAAAPIGTGHAQGGSAAANSSVAPAITLQNLSGSSLVLAIHFHKGVTAFGAAPAGYTQRLASTTGLVAVNTLNDTTVSPGAVTQTDTSVSGGYRGEQIEILALPAGLSFVSRIARNSLLRR